MYLEVDNSATIELLVMNDPHFKYYVSNTKLNRRRKKDRKYAVPLSGNIQHVQVFKLSLNASGIVNVIG